MKGGVFLDTKKKKCYIQPVCASDTWMRLTALASCFYPAALTAVAAAATAAVTALMEASLKPLAAENDTRH